MVTGDADSNLNLPCYWEGKWDARAIEFALGPLKVFEDLNPKPLNPKP